MALIIPLRGTQPQFGKSCFLAENATIVGDVVMGDECSVWFNAVVRGDVHRIRIGHRTNIQDGAIIHCTYQKAPTIIGDEVSIAHSAIVHGCTLGNNVLVGMGAIVMDHAVVGDGAIIAAGAVVLAGTEIPAGTLYAGMPARLVKEVSEAQKAQFAQTARNYLMYARWYESGGQMTE
ncbi:Carbonic anhydrase or acetyltransferase, isoleucine patch superfamily [Catalinimonas alkaloidigena]|uniref:Carbonic anhydrase or acetyltransferase, isoleucine patch superfamily n=1 Tax=Catalinimonas alkaloidigena TaxID=1075417 RepID=A0A1G9FD19_9BACT|nr:gamma carbonic anhydrase family protein [Catalinimonas alkaloidigena]SDK86294.1 Carbonic anhydrase or acetyltransferase, isoleucine patch superfamily [Catalinimonas alkaloidigena]